MLVKAAIAACILTVACSDAGNFKEASYTRHGTGYSVEMKARRRLLAHDPISFIRGRTYVEALTLELPAIQGVIQGSDIPVGPGKQRYVGRVDIAAGTMKVDLYYDNRDDSSRVPLPWNGEYRLVEK